MTTKVKPRFRISLENDHDAENPSEWSLFKVVSFNDRHSSYQNPDLFLPCHYESDRGNNLNRDGEVCDEMPWNHSYGMMVDAFGGQSEHPEIANHEYQPNPDILFPLSYYEHGLCRWSLGGRGPSCRWDSVGFAGLLLWDAAESERAWFDAKTDEEKQEYAESFLNTYTDWCNGDVNVVVIEKWNEEDGEWEDWEAVGGVYGSDVKDFVLNDMLGNFEDPEIEFAEDWYGW